MPQVVNVLAPDLIAAIEAGDVIIAPSRRSSHRLKLAYAHDAMAQGRGAWLTPTILPMSAWVLQLWRQQLERDPSADKIRVLSTEQTQLVWDRVVAESSWSATLLSPQAAARSAYRSWERTIGWQIKRDDLQAYADASGSAETRALLAWSDRFQELCDERHWLPAALLPHRLLQFEWTQPPNIFVVGTETLRPIDRALLSHLERSGARWQPMAPAIAADHLASISTDSFEHELQLAAQWAQQQIKSGCESIGIVVPDLEMRRDLVCRLFDDVFNPAARTLPVLPSTPLYAIAATRRLLDFPVVRAALDILQLIAGHASSTLVGMVLRSPFIGESAQEAGPRSLADAQLRNQSREHYDLIEVERVSTATHCHALVRRLQAARVIRANLSVSVAPSVVAEQFAMLWRTMGWPGEQTLDSEEHQTVARLHECLANFGALDELLGSLSFKTAVYELEQLAASIKFEPHNVTTPITLIDTQTTDGLQFEAVWVMGNDATRWPPPADPDPFLPIELQIRVGLPQATASAQRDYARQRFLRLERLAPTVVMSWAKVDEASKSQDVEMLPTPWLQGLPSLTTQFALQPSHRAMQFAARPVLENLQEATAPPLLNARAIGGTRIFELQSQCPFRAQAELRLQARPLDEVAPSVDARERGTLIHAALADIWQVLGGTNDLLSRTPEQLEVLVRTSLARHVSQFSEGASLHRMRMLQIEQVLAAKRIVELLMLDKTRAPFRVVGRPETQETVAIGPLEFKLRLDRVDELVSGEYDGQRIIVDYKTGGNISTGSWFNNRPEQPQLPLYAVTHPQNLVGVVFAPISAKTIGYQGVTRAADLLPGVKQFDDRKLPPHYTGWQGLQQFWQEIIDQLATQYAAGVADVDPLPNACRYCHLATLCRVHEQEENNIVDESSEL